MTCSRYALAALVLMAAACGGAVNSDGSGGGIAVGGSGGGVIAGGAGNGTAGSGTGGSDSGSDGATSNGNGRACTRDSDCTQCVYTAAPTSANQCDGVLGCCGGQVMNTTTCSANQAAWNANCSSQGYAIPSCPCVACGNCSLGCSHGECGFWPNDSGAAGAAGTSGSGGSGGGTLDAAYDALPKNCIDQWGGGQPAVCCPEPAPDCTGKPDGYPGYGCVERQNQFCACQCQGGTWTCTC
jgi:hypothetical protein